MSTKYNDRNMTKTVLTIAGSDSGGSAGIQADLKTFEARGVFGTSAITILTAQDTRRVHAAQPVAEAFIEAQIRAVLDDIGADAVKTGLLARVGVVQLVAQVLPEYHIKTIVVDPVMLDGYGKVFVSAETIDAYRNELFPLAKIITPNLDEARILTGQAIESADNMKDAARALHDLGPEAVLLKGGHLPDDGEMIDLLYDGDAFHELRSPRLTVDNPHGVGCTLASAIAAELAKDQELLAAVTIAQRYLHRALAASPKIGSGRSPVLHTVGRPPT